MPLGSLIGSKQGVKAEEFIKILIEEIDIPIVVDAGIGVPEHARHAMAIGADAVLVNTAVATSANPITISQSFAEAVIQGREDFLQNSTQENSSAPLADASSPLTGFLYE